MATNENSFTPNPRNKHLRTSIGKSSNTRPRNKHKRRAFKRYKGQGKAI